MSQAGVARQLIKRISERWVDPAVRIEHVTARQGFRVDFGRHRMRTLDRMTPLAARVTR